MCAVRTASDAYSRCHHSASSRQTTAVPATRRACPTSLGGTAATILLWFLFRAVVLSTGLDPFADRVDFCNRWLSRLRRRHPPAAPLQRHDEPPARLLVRNHERPFPAVLQQLGVVVHPVA